MSVRNVPMSDFSGGQVPRLAASDFSERQWSSIRGLVMEDPTRLRSQWPVQRVGDNEQGFEQLGVVRGWLVAKKPGGSFWVCPPPGPHTSAVGTRNMRWTRIGAPGHPVHISDVNLNIICQVPWRQSGSSVGFREGLLLNGRNRSGNAFVIVPPTSGNNPADVHVAAYPRFPSGSNAFIPPANVGAMWGDHLVLGDIRWVSRETDPFGSGNNTTYPNGLWYSSPTSIEQWATVDVEFVSFYDDTGAGSNFEIRSLQQVEAGMMVFCGSGIAMLRGTSAPNDHDFEPLRAGLGVRRGRGAVSAWSQTGNVFFADNGGRLFSTDSADFAHVNEGTALPARKDLATEVCPLLTHLLVAHEDGRLLYLRAIENEAVWGELVTPTSGVREMLSVGGQAYWLDDAGRCWRFTVSERRDSERGRANGQVLELRLASRTMALGGNHEKSFWHRLGVRGKGPGMLKYAILRPGPALGDNHPRLMHEPRETMGSRYRRVFRAHGPSAEASADLRFEGDVEVESVDWWVHQGSGER